MGNFPTKLMRRQNNNLKPDPVGYIYSVPKAEAQGVDRQHLVTILLQGSGESGKSTIMKQMEVLHGRGFSDEYRRERKNILLYYLVESAVTVLQVMNEYNKAQMDQEAVGTIMKEFPEPTEKKNFKVNKDLAKAIVTVCKQDAFLSTLAHEARSLAQDGLLDMLLKFERHPEWGGAKWLPDEDDILRTRVRTIGENMFYYRAQDTYYEMIDTGGQKSPRRRYMNLFTNVEVILFVASLIDFDRTTFENPDVNRLDDSLELFGNLTRNPIFKNTGIILFLNKFDLFKKMYKDNVPLPRRQNFDNPPVFSQERSQECQLALDWFIALYKREAPESKLKDITVHRTTATDTTYMRVVIFNVTRWIVERNLRDAAMV